MKKIYALYNEEKKSYYDGDLSYLKSEDSPLIDTMFFPTIEKAEKELQDIKKCIDIKRNSFDKLLFGCNPLDMLLYDSFLQLKIVEFTPQII